MKVLFLDVDGVLNWKNTMAYLGINRKMTKRLHRVLRETGAKVVLSSTWRKLDESYEMFIRKTGIRPISKTPNTMHGIRGREIEQWLKDHPEVTSYAIVDDDGDMLPEQAPFFVQTSYDTGLTDEHADMLIAVLNDGAISTMHRGPVFALDLEEDRELKQEGMRW